MSSQKKERKKKKKSVLETEIQRIIQKSLKVAVDKAMEDIFKEWK